MEGYAGVSILAEIRPETSEVLTWRTGYGGGLERIVDGVDIKLAGKEKIEKGRVGAPGANPS